MSMKKQENLYTIFTEVSPPHGLYEAILRRVALAERRHARISVGFFGFATFVLGAALVPAIQYAITQLYASGFYDYFSLLFSDSSFALTYWREFSLSLVESLPALALLLVIPLVVALVWSLRRTVQTARIAFTYGNI
jgi:hypothetical protein